MQLIIKFDTSEEAAFLHCLNAERYRTALLAIEERIQRTIDMMPGGDVASYLVDLREAMFDICRDNGFELWEE